MTNTLYHTGRAGYQLNQLFASSSRAHSLTCVRGFIHSASYQKIACQRLKPVQQISQTLSLRCINTNWTPILKLSTSVTKTGRSSHSVSSSQTKPQEANGDPAEKVFEAIALHRRRKPAILQPALFAVTVTVVSFGIAYYLTKREQEYLVKNTGGNNPTFQDLYRTLLSLRLKEAQSWIQRMAQAGTPRFIAEPIVYAMQKWLNLSIPEQVGVTMVAVNSIIFLAWQIRVPAVQTFMAKHFLDYALSRRSYTMLTACFSHEGLFHFGANMYCTFTFMNTLGFYLSSKELFDPSYNRNPGSRLQLAIVDPTYIMWAFFLSAGVMSALGGRIYTAWRFSRSMRMGNAAAAAAAVRPGLGFSGISFAILSCIALAVPETRVSLLFVPYPFPLSYAITGAVALDTAALATGRVFWGHHVHLAGVAFGAAYFYGSPWLWKWIWRTDNKSAGKRVVS